MSIVRSVYNGIFKRTSTFVMVSVASVFFFERTFDLASEAIFENVNKGKLYQDIKRSE